MVQGYEYTDNLKGFHTKETFSHLVPRASVLSTVNEEHHRKHVHTISSLK